MFAMGPAFFKQAGASYATLTLTGTFAAATVGSPYSSSIPISGGLEPYALTGGTGVASGALDSGFSLTITGSAGARFLTLSCASPTTADTMTFTASVDSSDGQTATSAQSIAVSAGTVLSTWDAAKAPPLITLTSSTVAKCTSTVSYNTGGGITPKSTGKWAFVCTLGGSNDGYVGVGAPVGADTPWHAGFKPGDSSIVRGDAIGLSNFNGVLSWTSETLGTSSVGSATGGVPAGTAVTILLDLDSTPQTIKFYIGNTLKNSLSLNAGLRGLAWVPLYSLLNNNQTVTINAGQTTVTIPTPEAANGYNAYWG